MHYKDSAYDHVTGDWHSNNWSVGPGDMENGKKIIESMHKDLYDMNHRPVKKANIYTTKINLDGATFTKVAEIEQFSIDDTGITGLEGDSDATVNSEYGNVSGVDKRNQPQGIDATIPGNSFLNHDTLAAKQAHYNTNFNKNHISKNNPLIHDTIAFKKYADPDMMQYEGVGSVFGEGLGPQDASENITDVEEGPKGPSSTQHSTTELPGAQQGQQVIPGGGTSWFTASAYFNDDDYRYHNVNDSRKHQDYNLGLSDVNSIDDDSDTDDEDDYTNPDNW